jgi:pantetheine-phosphate adenylyltransferase
MKVAVYPGSFNPWHEGHTDVLLKAKKAFDKIYVAIGTNPEKDSKPHERVAEVERAIAKAVGPAIAYDIEVHLFVGLLADYVKEMEPNAIIRGLRNANDLEFEKTQQYWNEDLGIVAPTFYVVTDRKLSHISSSAIRMLERFKK